MSDATAHPRYRFGEFVVSPAQRVLVRSGRVVPLIPRYLDLLLLLIERRHEAVHRREIFDRVWSDVVVSDGALSQAVRTLRRALGDGSREPVFIRTVSRHGYQFVHAGIVAELDEGPLHAEAPPAPRSDSSDPFESALTVLCDPAGDAGDRFDAAERLHGMGTDEALRRLGTRAGHQQARALLRDARWSVPVAGPVPLLGQPGLAGTVRSLVWLRLRDAARLAKERWAGACAGGALAGACGGLLGGLFLATRPDGPASWRVLAPLTLVGLAIGGLGAAGVGAGLAVAEAVARSFRALGLVSLGAFGGGLVGALSHTLGRWALEGLFGHELSFVGGGYEGLVIGAGAGLGYALATHPPRGGGFATPRGGGRARAALVAGLVCAVVFVALAHAGGHLGGVSLDFMARSFQGSQVGLAPLAHLLREAEVGPRTRTLLAAYEGLLFGFGLTLGITRRPRPAARS